MAQFLCSYSIPNYIILDSSYKKSYNSRSATFAKVSDLKSFFCGWLVGCSYFSIYKNGFKSFSSAAALEKKQKLELSVMLFILCVLDPLLSVFVIHPPKTINRPSAQMD